MSKPISFGFGKPKVSTPSSSKTSAPKPITLPSSVRPKNVSLTKTPRGALGNDSDNEDEAPPQPEAVTGFTSFGAILSKTQDKKEERVIANSGNGDWRKRGRTNILPAEVQAAQQAQQNGGDMVKVERNEVSTASGLQFAKPSDSTQLASTDAEAQTLQEPEKELTEDERALQALLDDGTGKPKSNAVIETKGNVQLNPKDETDDFRADVASRPESSTLEDYAAMPVEEFGMAMLRGMGQKRRANGEVITFGRNNEDKNGNKKQRKQEGFLGIGAKPAPGLEGVELGAWGKAEMRKNNKGQGFFTPVMLEDKRTGERISEEELERRKKEAKAPKKEEEEDWRSRRDKNLKRDGRDNPHRDTNGSKKRDRDDRDDKSRSRRDRDHDTTSRSRSDRDDRGYESRPRKDESRDKDYESSKSGGDRDRRRRDDTDSTRKDRDKYRDRDRDRYDSSSSRHSGHRERDREKERDRDRDDRRHHARD